MRTSVIGMQQGGSTAGPSGIGKVALTAPTISGLTHWFDAQAGVTLSSTLRVRSTSTPPTIASASSLAQAIPVWGIVQTAGSIGTARVDASANSGFYRSIRNQLAGSSMALAGTDCSLNFTGTLASTDVFQTVVASLKDQLTSATFTSVDQSHSPPIETRGAAGTGNQNIFARDLQGAGLNNLNTIQAQGSQMTTTGISVMVTSASFCIVIAARITGGLALGNDAAYVAAANNSSTDATNYFIFGHNGAGKLVMECRNTGNKTTRLVQSSGAGTNHSDFVGALRYDSSTGEFTLFRNGVNVGSVTANTGSLGAINWSNVQLFGLRRRPLGSVLDSNQINGMLHCVAFVNRAPSDSEVADFSAQIMNRYGIIEPVTSQRIVIVGDSNAVNWPSQVKWGIDAQDTGSGSAPELVNYASPGNPMSGDPNNPSDFSGGISGGQLGQVQSSYTSGAILINGIAGVNIHNDGTGDVGALLTNTDTWWTKVTGYGYSPNRIIMVIFPYMSPGVGQAITSSLLTKQQQWADYCYAKVPDRRQVVDFRAIPGTPNDSNYWFDNQHIDNNGIQAAGSIIVPAYQYCRAA